MCPPTNGSSRNTKHGKSNVVTTNTSRQQPPPRIMLSLESFSHHITDIYDKKSDDEKINNNNNRPPPMLSCMYTCITYIIGLIISEQIGRYIFQILDDYTDLLPPVLSSSSTTTNDVTNQHILVRHLFVDTLSCIICACLGWYSRYESFYPIIYGNFTITTTTTTTSTKNKNYDTKSSTSSSSSCSSSSSTYEERLTKYMPNAFRLSIFFFAYQIKNLYDTIVWDDGPEYIFHHIFSLITAYGSMIISCGHVYTIFFFGISEISTAILCVLANFDDTHGIVGLGETFPNMKVLCGIIFVILFIICRCILWPIHAYHFCNDILSALRIENNDPKPSDYQTRRYWMIFFLTSLSSLSVLQILWLGQIFILGKQELEKLGFI